MLTVAVVYTFAADRETEAQAHLRALLAASPHEPGCRRYEVHRAKDDARKFLIFEQYDDEAALESHRATPHFIAHAKNGLQTIMEAREATQYVPFA